MDKITKILKNSGELNVLDHRIDETVKRRDKSLEERELWKSACKEFHQSFDELFFPGGHNNLLKVRKGDLSAIESAIDFLIADPRHHRSGYVKEELWYRARKWSLPPTEKTRLEKAALAYLEKQIRRDFWYMCRTMARIATPQFWQQVTQKLCSENPLIAKRASYLFAYSLGIEAGEKVRTQVYYEILRKRYG
jgi:hypothetical protein